jgi:putative cardiolipin synthase
VSVSILTNSFESGRGALAHAGYTGFRPPLLGAGVDLYEARALVGSSKGSGQTARLSRYGTYGLHAKLFVFDSEAIFVGSMNFDKRSRRLNTEVGLIIESPELAAQVAARFRAMVQPENAYAVVLRSDPGGGRKRLVWRTQEHGQVVDYSHEPGSRAWQRLWIRALARLPVSAEL